MERLIDADKLKSDYDIRNWEEPYGCSFNVIDRQPTVDAEPVPYGGYVLPNKIQICPDCGAKMEEESENE